MVLRGDWIEVAPSIPAQRLEQAGAVAQGVRVAGGVTATLLLVARAVYASPALALSLNNESVPMDDESPLKTR
jgi:hypothetical protein